MRGIAKTLWIVSSVTLAIAVASVSVGQAQQLDTGMVAKGPTPKPPDQGVLPPAAPVPAQILSGKKAFISNLGADTTLILPNHFSGSPDRTYDQFYSAMKSWGRYQLVAAPSDSDLILEIGWFAPVGPADVFQGRGGSGIDPQFKLTIRDPKTLAALWAFTEHFDFRHATHDQSFDQAMARIVDDLKKLSASAPNAADSRTNR